MKTETKHTPGPWKIASDYTSMQKGRCDIVAWKDQGCPIARCVAGTLTSPKDPMESVANAQLIAAAPDLLEACKAIMAWASTSGNHGGNPYTKEFVKLADAAIQKAEGQ